MLRSANVIAAIANAGLGGLFARGTESGKGWHDTTVKGEAFTHDVSSHSRRARGPFVARPCDHIRRARAGRACRLGDRAGGGNTSWNSAHKSRGCSQDNLVSTGGAGLLYCFATN